MKEADPAQSFPRAPQTSEEEKRESAVSDRSLASSFAVREALVLALTVLLLALTYYHGNPQFVPLRGRFFFWVGLNVVLLLLVPVALVRLVFRESLSSYGLGLGRPAVWLRWLGALMAVMLPVLLVSSRLASLQYYYPRYVWARDSALLFALSSAAWLVYFFAWEFFFRGFLLHFFLRRHPPIVAIALQTVPFAMMHFTKPEVEALASIIAGFALGFMAYRGRSMLGPWLLHWLCAFTLDVLVVVWPVRSL